MTLSPRDAQAFVEAVLNPPPPSPKLLAAADRYKALMATTETKEDVFDAVLDALRSAAFAYTCAMDYSPTWTKSHMDDADNKIVEFRKRWQAAQ